MGGSCRYDPAFLELRSIKNRTASRTAMLRKAPSALLVARRSGAAREL